MGSNWVEVRHLGTGSFGSVHLVIYKDNKDSIDKLVAIKKSKLEDAETLEREKRIYGDLNSNHCTEIVTCFGNDITIDRDHSTYYNLILEYASWGTLDDLIMRRSCMGETNIRIYTKMILKGLSYIHAKGYVHCDLKPENILVFPCSKKKKSRIFQLKIADFGLARAPEEMILPSSENGRFVGSPAYMSPESVDFWEISSALDIWSLGCVVVEMYRGVRAWPNYNKEKIIDVLIRDDKIPNIPRSSSKDAKDFLGKCFERDYQKRWSAKMLLDHPFVTDPAE